MKVQAIDSIEKASLQGRSTSDLDRSPSVVVAQAPGFVQDRLRIQLESAGYRVQIAESATRALHTMLGLAEAVVVIGELDDAPDPLGLCHELRNVGRSHSLFVIVLSVAHYFSDHVCALDAGADDVAPTKISRSEFLARVRVAERTLSARRTMRTGAARALRRAVNQNRPVDVIVSANV